MGNEIFKIQKPVLGFVWLIYNEDRSTMVQMSEEYVTAEMIALMGDDYKVYVEGYLDQNSIFHVGNKVEEQQW